MIEMLIKKAKLPTSQELVDIAIVEDKIVEVSPNLELEAKNTIFANGNLVIPPFVDSHFHLDATLSLGMPRLNQSGTLLEGIALWNELKSSPEFTVENLKRRALEYCHWAIAQGILAIRSHVDVCDDRLIAVEAMLEVQKEIAPYLDLQLVAFPQDGYLRDPNAVANLKRAIDKGIDVVGGIPHAERTMEQGAESIKLLMEFAEKKGLMVDMHCDESDDPNSRHIETLSAETVRLGMQGKVAGSHLTAMHSYDNYYFEKLKSLMLEANIQVITNPLINITLQGRFDTYPKRRGFTRVPELNELGLNVSMAQDCVMDPWYSGGKADMFEVVSMGYHIAHMTNHQQIARCFDMITKNPAKTLGLENYGVEKGCDANLIILNASDVVEAIRLKAEKIAVIRRGKIIATTTPAVSKVNIFNQNQTIDYKR